MSIARCPRMKIVEWEIALTSIQTLSRESLKHWRRLVSIQRIFGPQGDAVNWMWNCCLIGYNYAGINVIQNHPPGQTPGTQKPHSRDIRLENFTNISRTSNTIWNEKLCGLTNKMVCQWGEWFSEYISFGSHQSHYTECMKALYDMFKCMLVIFWEKGAWNFTKKYFECLSIPSKFFYS